MQSYQSRQLLFLLRLQINNDLNYSAFANIVCPELFENKQHGRWWMEAREIKNIDLFNEDLFVHQQFFSLVFKSASALSLSLSHLDNISIWNTSFNRIFTWIHMSECLCSIKIGLSILNCCSCFIFWDFDTVCKCVNKSIIAIKYMQVIRMGQYIQKIQFPAKNIPLVWIVLCGMLITHCSFI